MYGGIFARETVSQHTATRIASRALPAVAFPMDILLTLSNSPSPVAVALLLAFVTADKHLAVFFLGTSLFHAYGL